MSAIAQIEQRVRELIAAALEVLYTKNKTQDKRLDAVEARLDALEAPATAAAPAAKTAPRQTVAAKAQTAAGKGGAH
jgi:hypothetical protein